MANYATLKAAIAAAIRENGNNEITGNLLQQQLLAMVNSLGVGYQYAGIATPATNPGTPDQNVFYFASTAGTYTNFGSLVLADGEIAILKYNGAWSKDSTGAVSLGMFNQLGQKIQDLEFRDSVYDGELNLDIFKTGYINCIESPITFIRTGSSPWQSAVVAVRAGEKYNVKSYSTSVSAYGIAVFNKNRELLSHQDTSNTFVEVTIEQDGFLVVNHGYNSTPELIREKIYSAEEKREILKDWILSESYYLRGVASYTDGVINSPINVYYPDDSIGEITLTRNADGLVTALSATNVQFGLRLNMTISRNADGTASAQSITFQSI